MTKVRIKTLYEQACSHAETSTDPIATMLRNASACLEKNPPDILGAKVCLQVARLGYSAQEIELDRLV